MTKIYFIGIFISSFLSAQMSLGSYQSGSGKKYNLELTQKKFIMVDVPSTDALSRDIFLKLSFNKAKNFKERMTEAKFKYEEWKFAAEKNGVKEFSKKLNVDMGSFDMVFDYGQNYYFARNVDLDAYMTVDDNGIYFELRNKNRLISDANQFIKTEGFALRFSDVGQISDFINSIDLIKGEELYKENRNSNKLFD